MLTNRIKKIIARSFIKLIASRGGTVYFPKQTEALQLIRKIKSETEMLLSDYEALKIYELVKKITKLTGDIAEVGAYKGGSAKLICYARENDRPVHLFDTFEGLPGFSEEDTKVFGKMLASFEEVKKYLKDEKNVYIYKGLFPETSGPIVNKRFSFVHLDADLYKSTLNSLDFFYPRMVCGGIILSHDYHSSRGVKLAFDTFFEKKPEIVIELTLNQCMVICTNN